MNIAKALRGVAVVLALAGSSLAHADPVSDARTAMKALQADYNKIDAAANARNVKGFLAYNAPDYAIVDKSDAVRAQGGAELAEGYAAFFAQSKSYHQQTSIQKLTLHGAEAVVTVKQRIERSAINPNTRQRVSSVMNGLLEETWLRTGPIWQRTRTKALQVQSTENGKSVTAR